MEPASPFRVPNVPGTPLYALSPERINQQRLPPSPSLPSHLSSPTSKHHRNSSVVSEKIAFLNSLGGSNHTSPTRQPAASSHAALQRAILGREEAEAQLSSSYVQLAEVQNRERRIAERVESLMEELHTVKERQAHERRVFEKEVRKARKEAFKADSLVVKAQEELKEGRAEIKELKCEVHREKSSKERAKQEAFERAYTLSGMMEEAESLRERLRVVESERDAALLQQQAQALHQGDNKDTASEEQEPLPTAEADEKQTDTGSKSPRRNRFRRFLPPSTIVNEDSPLIKWQRNKVRVSILDDFNAEQDASDDLQEQLEDLKAELRWERTLLTRAEELIEHMHIECQFKVCSCRIAESQGCEFVHDKAYAQRQREQKEEQERQKKIDEEAAAMVEADQTETAIEASDSAANETATGPDDTVQQVQAIVAREISRSRTPHNALMREMSHNSAPHVRQEVTAPVPDLFSLSPPKQLTPRPATAMGVMALQSPIRIVPHSPMPESTTPSDEPAKTASMSRYAATPTSGMTKSPSAYPYPITPGFKTPMRPFPRTVQAVTTTTMVPLRGLEDDDVFSPAPQNMPGTPISREAALEQIRARRDRARSMNLKANTCKSAPGSARRGLGGGVRDISAPGPF